eukprot:gene2407-60893_t
MNTYDLDDATPDAYVCDVDGASPQRWMGLGDVAAEARRLRADV